jgi:glycosyltransferase involved in cell wall biosynthesis
VVRNGVDEDVFYPDPDSNLVKEKCGRLAVLVLSRRDRRKGFDLLSDIFKRTQRLTSVGFEIWSVGELCAGEFDGYDHHDFGYVSEEKLRRIMSSADVFLYPSRHEGFPLMVLEALSCNCAVVTTEAVSFVHDGKEALVSPVEDCDSLSQSMAKVISDESLRMLLSSRGLELAKRCSLKISSQNFCDSIEAITLTR